MARGSQLHLVIGKVTHRLMGLLAMASIGFAAFVTFSWVISVVVDYLSSIHPFHAVASRLVAEAEVGAMYVFTFVCGVIVAIGVFRALFRSLGG